MFCRLVLIGCVIWLWVPASAQQTQRGDAEVADWHQQSPPTTQALRLLAPPSNRLEILPSPAEVHPGRDFSQATPRPGSKSMSNLFVRLPNQSPLFTPITRERAQRWIIDNLRRLADADASIRTLALK